MPLSDEEVLANLPEWAKTLNPCPECNGLGHDPGGLLPLCIRCHGKRKLEPSVQLLQSALAETRWAVADFLRALDRWKKWGSLPETSGPDAGIRLDVLMTRAADALRKRLLKGRRTDDGGTRTD